MKIEEIRNALKNKAQSLNVAPMTTVPMEQKPVAPTVAQPKVTPKQEQPAVVIPLNNAQAPEPPVQPEPKQSCKPATTRGTKGKGKAAPLSDIEKIIAEHLRPGIDFDIIPGCSKKPALLKAGAEYLLNLYNYHTFTEVIHRIEHIDKSFILYETRTTIFDADGNIVACGIGSANTQERKFAKQGFPSALNNCLKISKKRSLVDAVLTATGASRVFTQDLEDIVAIEAEQDKMEA